MITTTPPQDRWKPALLSKFRVVEEVSVIMLTIQVLNTILLIAVLAKL